MMRFWRSIPLWLMVCVVMFGAREAWAQDGTGQGIGQGTGGLVQVFIDARQEAYVIFQGISDITPAVARREMEGYANLEGVSLVTWNNFRDNVDVYVARGIVKNEYPGGRTALGILALIKAHPGRPFAVTWNGGIASSFFDFQHAVETLEDFREDANAYEQLRTLDTGVDPLNPELQLRALLNG